MTADEWEVQTVNVTPTIAQHTVRRRTVRLGKGSTRVDVRGKGGAAGGIFADGKIKANAKCHICPPCSQGRGGHVRNTMTPHDWKRRGSDSSVAGDKYIHAK